MGARNHGRMDSKTDSRLAQVRCGPSPGPCDVGGRLMSNQGATALRKSDRPRLRPKARSDPRSRERTPPRPKARGLSSRSIRLRADAISIDQSNARRSGTAFKKVDRHASNDRKIGRGFVMFGKSERLVEPAWVEVTDSCSVHKVAGATRSSTGPGERRTTGGWREHPHPESLSPGP
jgi:hypothetical protein